MSTPLNYCGHRDRKLAARKCLACKRIAQRIHRGQSLEEAQGAYIKQPTCQTCKVRYFVTPPKLRDGYKPMLLDPAQVRWLENAARLFDALSEGDAWTAEEFIAWLRPDLTGHPNFPDMAGLSISLGGGRKGAGKGTTRISTPDPIPYAALPPKIRGAA